MELSNMTLEEVEARLSAVAEEIEAATEVEVVNTLADEKRSLVERQKELADLAERKAQAEAIDAGILTGRITERMEETTMEENKNYGLDSQEYRSAFIKTLQGKALNEEEQRAYAQSGIQGAVPEVTANKFIEKMKKLAPMLNKITLMQVKGNLTFMVEGNRAAAGKHTENNAESAAADTLVKVTLGAFEFMKLIAISKSAADLAIDAFEGWLVDMLSGDIARAIDDYILNDATNGLSANTAITSTKISATSYTYANVLSLIAGLPAAYDAEAEFLMNKSTLYNQVANIVDSQGRPIFVPDPTVGVGRVLGYPVVLDDYVTASKSPIYLGKFADIVGNLSQGIQVEKSTEAGFTSGTIYYRGYAQFDSKLAKADGIVKMYLT